MLASHVSWCRTILSSHLDVKDLTTKKKTFKPKNPPPPSQKKKSNNPKKPLCSLPPVSPPLRSDAFQAPVIDRRDEISEPIRGEIKK